MRRKPDWGVVIGAAVAGVIFALIMTFANGNPFVGHLAGAGARISTAHTLPRLDRPVPSRSRPVITALVRPAQTAEIKPKPSIFPTHTRTRVAVTNPPAATTAPSSTPTASPTPTPSASATPTPDPGTPTPSAPASPTLTGSPVPTSAGAAPSVT